MQFTIVFVNCRAPYRVTNRRRLVSLVSLLYATYPPANTAVRYAKISILHYLPLSATALSELINYLPQSATTLWEFFISREQSASTLREFFISREAATIPVRVSDAEVHSDNPD